jgi:hypothetical protein
MRCLVRCYQFDLDISDERSHFIPFWDGQFFIDAIGKENGRENQSL